MLTRAYALAGVAAAGLALAAASVLSAGRVSAPFADAPARTAGAAPAGDRKPREPRLYCEFYNFVGRTPKVGFYFAIEEAGGSPAYAQVFQREMDGSQVDFGQDGQARPAWAFEGGESPATLRSPDGAIQINLYGYDRARPGTTWFEAGLRSVQYLNLDGKCRQTDT